MEQTIDHETPQLWSSQISGPTVAVMPLVDEPGNYPRGWCTYADTLAGAPEVEIISGGINTKAPDAAALWRQGNLMHFGFDLSPDQMNQTAKAMLINSIVYISRFTEDRPNVTAPTPYAGIACSPRSTAVSYLSDEPLASFEALIHPQLLGTIGDRTRQGYLAWFEAHRRYLRPDDDGWFVIDADLKLLDVLYDVPEFFDKCFAALADPSTTGIGRRLLARFAPLGPVGQSTDAWRKWYAVNEPYLFFSEWGQYRWYIDTLAKERGVPSAQLRGVARASR